MISAYQETPEFWLGEAACLGNVAGIAQLLAKGANPNGRFSHDSGTAVDKALYFYAVYASQGAVDTATAAVRLLVEAGGRPDLVQGPSLATDYRAALARCWTACRFLERVLRKRGVCRDMVGLIAKAVWETRVSWRWCEPPAPEPPSSFRRRQRALPPRRRHDYLRWVLVSESSSEEGGDENEY